MNSTTSYDRELVINAILKYLNIRLSLDKLYENYTNRKYHKKIVKYNKERGVIHPRNPYSLFLNGEPIPEFIKIE